jgi:hypothetical protein
MASNDDEILLGARVLTGKVPDTDGDGVSDAEEALAGTDPQDASDHPDRDPILKPRDDDPRGDLGREGIERETTFDPAANMPEGTTIDSGLDGMANLDGSDLSKGQNHFGVGEDELLQGRGDESPASMLRDALGGARAGGSGPSGPDADLSFNAPNMDLVSGEGDSPDEDWLEATPPPPPPPVADPPSPPPEQDREPPPPPGPDGSPPQPDPDPGPAPLQTDPDAGGGAPTAEDIERALAVRGGDTNPVDGGDGAPRIDADAPPPPKTDLVRDGGETGDLGTADAPRGAPDAPVVHTINPDSGYTPRPASEGGPQPSAGDDAGFGVDPTAAAFGGDGLQAMDGTADLGSVADAQLDIDVGAVPDDDMEQEPGGFGGPLDDGFD